jgi:hypothetical protein
MCVLNIRENRILFKLIVWDLMQLLLVLDVVGCSENRSLTNYQIKQISVSVQQRGQKGNTWPLPQEEDVVNKQISLKAMIKISTPWTKTTDQLVSLFRQCHGEAAVCYFFPYKLDDEIRGVSMGLKGKYGEYALTADGWKFIPEEKQSLAPLLKKTHVDAGVYYFFTYKLGDEIRGVSLGEMGKIGEYTLTAAGWKSIPERKRLLMSLLKKIHVATKVYYFFTYKLGDEIRGVSLGEMGKIGEYTLTAAGWKSIPERKQSLAPLLKKMHVNAGVYYFFPYKLGDEIRGVSLGEMGKYGEYTLTAAGWRSIPEEKQSLAPLLRLAHQGNSWVAEVFVYQLGDEIRGVFLGGENDGHGGQGRQEEYVATSATPGLSEIILAAFFEQMDKLEKKVSGTKRQ